MTSSAASVVQSAAACSIADAELEDLLQQVYVQGGFTGLCLVNIRREKWRTDDAAPIK